MPENISIYWDFENIHASICTIKWGPIWYRENKFKNQPKLVDIKEITEYASSLGDININKAYANWANFSAYSFDLQDNAIDLIQLFPRGGHGKNGADIRMAIDVIEDINLNPHITNVIVIGGDSDYISIAQNVRQKGKKIIGIGIKETTNQFWIKSCNEFKFYSSLLLKTSKIDNFENEGYEEFDLDEAKQLLIKALKGLNSETGNNQSLRVSVKPVMLRLEPSFDESNYGFKTFTDFLIACNDVINMEVGEQDQLVSLKETSLTPIESIKIQSFYETILKNQKIRLIEPKKTVKALLETYNIFRRNSVNTYSHYTELLLKAMLKQRYEFTDIDANKVKALVYKTFSFKIDHENKKIVLSDDISCAEDLLFKVQSMLMKRIFDNIQESEIDVEKLSEILFGDKKHTDDIHMLMSEYNKVNACQVGNADL